MFDDGEENLKANVVIKMCIQYSELMFRTRRERPMLLDS